MLPDLLLPVTEKGFHIFYKQWRTLWITVRGKGTIPVGDHKLKFVFTAENGDVLGETSYTLKVLDGVLGEQTLLYTNWVHYDSICQYYHVKPFSARRNLKFISSISPPPLSDEECSVLYPKALPFHWHRRGYFLWR